MGSPTGQEYLQSGVNERTKHTPPPPASYNVTNVYCTAETAVYLPRPRALNVFRVAGVIHFRGSYFRKKSPEKNDPARFLAVLLLLAFVKRPRDVYDEESFRLGILRKSRRRQIKNLGAQVNVFFQFNLVNIHKCVNVLRYELKVNLIFGRLGEIQ